VSLDDPAFSVMTDLRDVRAATTTRVSCMSRAHAQMIQRGVRLLFVQERDAASSAWSPPPTSWARSRCASRSRTA
jgi:hypothetical protein